METEATLATMTFEDYVTQNIAACEAAKDANPIGSVNEAYWKGRVIGLQEALDAARGGMVVTKSGTCKLKPILGAGAKTQPTPALTLLEEEMLAALRETQRLIDEALPKFNWGASALDANAIGLLNETPLAVRAAIALAERSKQGGAS